MRIPYMLLTAALVLVLTGCDRLGDLLAKKPDIAYAPYGEGYASKPDLAQVEYEHPIPAAELAKITPRYLAGLEQEQLDQLYARLASGPIPDGAFDGEIVFPRGSSGRLRVAEIVGGFTGLAVDFKGKTLETLGEALWKGKVFYRDQKVLRNRIQDLAVLRPVIGPGDIPKIDVDGKDAWLLFPAKLYCGQSLLDSRRESIIIDYAFTDELPGYRERPDFLAGRRGLRVRDEIRMVRPGLYLGRAYMDHAFGLNFVLYNKKLDKAGQTDFLAGKVTDDCWSGTQKRVVAATG
nr:F308 [uncultured bacterium]